jgi:hypothetical protein
MQVESLSLRTMTRQLQPPIAASKSTSPDEIFFLQNVLDGVDVLPDTCALPLGWKVGSAVQVAVPQDAVQRRRYVRVKSPDILVAWQASTTRSVSHLETLGLGGMFVLTKQPPPLHSTLKLLLDLPIGEVRARAVVRRVNPLKGMGVEFISMTQEDRARLNKSLLAMPEN